MVARKKCLISILLLFAFVLSGCSLSLFKTGLPEKGIWYCEELEIEIDFSNKSYSYVNVDGNNVPCTINADYGSDWFQIGGIGGIHGGRVFFHGECDYWDEDKMLVTELLDSEGDEKGQSYLFVRVDK